MRGCRVRIFEGDTSMRIRDPMRVLITGLGLALIVAPMTTLAAPARQMAPSELTVLVGAGQDTQQLLNYFPQSIRVHAGDTVTWNINGDELHTVGFTQGVDFPPFPASIQAPVGRPGERIPNFVVPVPGGGQADLMLNPPVGFPTRMPGAPVE